MNTAVPHWAGMEIRRLSALARTQLTLFGAVDASAVATLRAAIADALAEGHDVWVDVGHITSVRLSALGELSELSPWVRP
jgi:hypothetical protein